MEIRPDLWYGLDNVVFYDQNKLVHVCFTWCAIIWFNNYTILHYYTRRSINIVQVIKHKFTNSLKCDFLYIYFFLPESVNRPGSYRLHVKHRCEFAEDMIIWIYVAINHAWGKYLNCILWMRITVLCESTQTIAKGASWELQRGGSGVGFGGVIELWTCQTWTYQ